MSPAIWRIVGFLAAVEIASGVLQGYYTPIYSDIADHLAIPDGDVNWFEAAQLIVAALAVPVLSRLGDLHGHRRVLIVATLIGGSLSAGAANTFNCVYDRDIDAKMGRTQNRPLVTGEVTPRAALVFGLAGGATVLPIAVDRYSQVRMEGALRTWGISGQVVPLAALITPREAAWDTHQAAQRWTQEAVEGHREFWSDLLEGSMDERCQEIIRGLRKEDDPEAAIIFCLRYQGWEISNDPELLLEEIENFRHTMSLAEAARTATGQCP